ncbi:MAG: TonB family protein [Terriglobales bacterium]
MLTILRFTCALILLLASGCIVSQTQTPQNSGRGAGPPSTSTLTFRVGGGVSAPHAIYAPDPEYPEDARRDGIEGACVLWIVVGPDGRPRNIRVQKVIGHGLDEKAIEAVRQWKFEPALLDGKPVAVQIIVEMSFHLNGSDLPSSTYFFGTGTLELKEQASSGDAKAELDLADAYFRGSGVPQSEKEGYRLLKEAANRGLPEAQFKLGEYIVGHGSQPGDYIAAYMWYDIAQRSRYKHSDKRLREISAKMSPENIAEAQKLAQDWKPSK